MDSEIRSKIEQQRQATTTTSPQTASSTLSKDHFSIHTSSTSTGGQLSSPSSSNLQESTGSGPKQRVESEVFVNSQQLQQSVGANKEPRESQPLQGGKNANNNNDQRSRTSVSSDLESQQLLGDAYNCCCRKLATRMPNSARIALAYFLAELVGTFLLVVIGDGAIAAYVLKTKEVDVLSVCLAFGVGAMIATFAAGKISGAHINPAASLAFALDGRLKWRLLPIYICAQYLGGFLGALALFVNYSEAIKSLDGGYHSYGEKNSTGTIFATYPGEGITIWGSLLDQILGTGILLFSLSAISDKRNANLEARHQPLIVALVIGLVCVAFSPNCGAIFNPARDLAPRLVTAIFGYHNAWSPLNGLYWIMAGILGPHIGAIIGVFAYELLIGSSLKLKLDLDEDDLLNKAGGGGGGCELSGNVGSSLRMQVGSKATANQPHYKTNQHHTGSSNTEFNYGSAMH